MDAKLPAPCGPRILLMDLDNCADQLTWLAEKLPSFHRVIACHGLAEPKLPLKLVKGLATAIHSGQLEFIRMKRGGKNAADFGLAFLAGELAAKLPADAEFVILSRDTGLDHIVDMLKRVPRKAQRVAGGGAHVPRAASAEPVLLDADEFCAGHLFRQTTGPRRKDGLKNAIRAYFKKRRPVKCEAVLAELIARGTVQFDDQGVATYHLPPRSEQRRNDSPETAVSEVTADEEIPF